MSLQDFKETFITEISTSIGAIKNILENIQSSIFNIPNLQYHENCKEKIEMLYKHLDKIQNDILNHTNILVPHISQTSSNNDLLISIQHDLKIILDLIKNSKLEQLLIDQNLIQHKCLNSNSDCNKVNTLILEKNKELIKILYMLNKEGLTINDFRDWAKHIKRSNAFYNEFTGWKKSLIIVVGVILFILYFFRDIISIIKSLAPLI